MDVLEDQPRPTERAMELTIKLTPEQLRELAAEIARIAAPAPAQKPLTVKAFADATGVSVNTVYRQVEAGSLRRVPGLAKVLIPAAELERFR